MNSLNYSQLNFREVFTWKYGGNSVKTLALENSHESFEAFNFQDWFVSVYIVSSLGIRVTIAWHFSVWDCPLLHKSGVRRILSGGAGG